MDTRSFRPSVLVVDDHPRDRLFVVAALATRFDVVPLLADEHPLRAARSRHPDLVLLSLGHRSADAALRTCRTLRTDVHPIDRVAVYTRGRPPRSAGNVCDTWRADGYLAGDFDAAAVVDFVEAVLRGERPVWLPDVAGNPLVRLVDRLLARPGRPH